MEKFDIVASNDGTIGWEAYKNFKPIIRFGKPWYLLNTGGFEV